MVSSQTGSGKTAAFLLPVINAIMAGSNNSPIDLHRVMAQLRWYCAQRVNWHNRWLRMPSTCSRAARVSRVADRDGGYALW